MLTADYTYIQLKIAAFMVKKSLVDVHDPIVKGPNENGFSFLFSFSTSLKIPYYQIGNL